MPTLILGGDYKSADIEVVEYGGRIVFVGRFDCGNLEVRAYGILVVLEPCIGCDVGLVGCRSKVAVKDVVVANLYYFVVEPSVDFLILTLIGGSRGGQFVQVAGLVEGVMDYCILLVGNLQFSDCDSRCREVTLTQTCVGMNAITRFAIILLGGNAKASRRNTCALVPVKFRDVVDNVICRDGGEDEAVVAGCSCMAILGEETLALVVDKREPITDGLIYAIAHHHGDRTVGVTLVVASALYDFDSACQVAGANGQLSCALDV